MRSTRTRLAFEVAAFNQRAHVPCLDPSLSELGHKESVAITRPGGSTSRITGGRATRPSTPS
jgi:hypothetical protein